MKKRISILAIVVSFATISLITSCVKSPEGAVAVKPFDKSKYLGKWYEIARLDFKHERNLNNTTAEYSLNDNGTIKVDNKGYNYVKNEWDQAIGKAKFVDDPNEARLKVSFFGPFYAGYNVIAIDANYQYALVAGASLDYMWILSRTTSVPESVKQDYLNKAKSLGYKTENLVWVEHDKAG